MENKLEKDVCTSCGNYNCTCEKEDNSVIKKKVFVKFDKNNNFDCDNECSCDKECSCESKKKALVLLGATIVTIGVAGGILYLVKNKK